jgi:hypothetical protein
MITGSEFVDLMLKVVPSLESRDHAVELGNRLLGYGLIEHVVREHPFRDGYFFYHFLADIDHGVLNMSRIWNQPINIPSDFVSISPPTESSLSVDLSVYLITLAIKLYQTNTNAIQQLNADVIKSSPEYEKFEAAVCQLQNVRTLNFTSENWFSTLKTNQS